MEKFRKATIIKANEKINNKLFSCELTRRAILSKGFTPFSSEFRYFCIILNGIVVSKNKISIHLIISSLRTVLPLVSP